MGASFSIGNLLFLEKAFSFLSVSFDTYLCIASGTGKIMITLSKLLSHEVMMDE
jgi:hypothetical protein